MHTDPRDIISQSAMTRLQYIVIAMTVGLNALDGFDVLAISFASPGIAAEWGMTQAGLGIVLSMELFGMAAGSILLGGVADRVGRRPTILGCLIAMAVGMFMVTTTDSLVELSVWRILTGLGIGGMLASINAMAAEFSNHKNRGFCISIMAIGYPIGGVVGGIVVGQLLEVFDWRSVFYFGTAVTLVFLPLFYFIVPESVHWLTRKQPVNALQRINETFSRLGHGAIAAMPTIDEDVKKKNFTDIFGPALLLTTVLVSVGYFLHITTFYFILKWVPKLVVDMGFSPSSASGVLTWASVGGALGGLSFGFLSLRYDLKKLTLIMFVFSWLFTGLFGQTSANLAVMSMFVASAGFFTNGGIVGMYAILAQVFPTHVRAFGTGFAVGFGRGGSVLSPIIAGFLLQGGLELPTLAIVMGTGSLLAAAVVLYLKLGPDDNPTQGSTVSEDEAIPAAPMSRA